MPFVWIGLLLPWLIVGLGRWIGYQLIRQNGRILLRLEALELPETGSSAPSRTSAMGDRRQDVLAVNCG